MQKLLFIYVALINLLAFILFFLDKRRAMGHRRRISEETLFFVSVLGGSIGAYSAMRLFHHKTHKVMFKIGIPLIILFHLATALVLF